MKKRFALGIAGRPGLKSGPMVLRNAGIMLIQAMLVISCSTTKKASDKDKLRETISFYAGGSQGGFVEESGIDAVSGATNSHEPEQNEKGLNFFAGVHWEHPVNKRGGLETGIDFTSHRQCLVYADPSLGFDGRLDLSYSRVSMPLTCNIGFIQSRNHPVLNFKTGISLHYIHAGNPRVSGNIPEFRLKKMAVSPLFNCTIVPFGFERYSMGLFFNTSLLKGSKVFYDDTYHNHNKTGLFSTMELGCYFNIKFQFRPACSRLRDLLRR